MDILSLLSLALAPGLAICIFIYWQDRFEKEPMRLLSLSFFLGMVSTIPAILLSKLGAMIGLNHESDSLIFSLISCILGIGLTEEYSKYFFVRYEAFKRDAFNEPFDGITYGVMVAMGFATLENVLYVFGAESEDGGGMTVGWLRMFTAVPSHATDGIIIGYFLGLEKYKGVKNFGLIGLGLAAVLHGFYDFFLFNSHVPGLILGALVSLILGIRYSLKAIKLHQQGSPFNPANNKSENVIEKE